VQIEEIESPLVSIFSLHGKSLVERKVSRGMFFRVLHPTYNPLISRAESTFLRGAAYALRRYQHDLIASAIDHMLRAPQWDIHMCIELRGLGCLDDDEHDEEAYRFLEEYEDMAQGDIYKVE
jgi:hypothetical protein